MWFWEVSPKHWTLFQWGVFFGGIVIMFVVIIIGCGIESIVELIL